MNKIAIIGAGKTGRGFIGRLLWEAGKEFIFVDKNRELVEELRREGAFPVHFFGRCRETMTVKGFRAYTWEDEETAAALAACDLIFVSVGGTNLPAVGAELKKRLSADKPYAVITCENASKPSKTLSDAIGLDNVRVSEATVFCTTNDGGRGTDGAPLAIHSENYPYLQCDADLLGELADGINIPQIRTIHCFGNFLTRKLFTYNAASGIIAYMGWLYGYSDYSAAANDERILALLDRNYAVTNRVLCAEFGYDPDDQAEFALLSKKKFTDRTISDTISRNAREPQRKLLPAERVIGPLTVIARHGEDTSVLEMTAAAMLLYDAQEEDAWREIKAEKTPREILRDICGLPDDHPSVERILSYRDEFEKAIPGR